MKENQFQRAARLHDLKLITYKKGWDHVKDFIFRAPRLQTLHDLSAADPEKLDAIEDGGAFLACPTIDEVMARPVTEFHSKPEEKGKTIWNKSVGGQTVKGNVVIVWDQAEGEDFLLQFYSPLEELTF